MTTLLLSFSNRSYSFLQIRRTTIKAWMSLNSFKIFEWIFLILAGNKDFHKSLNEFDFQPATELTALERLKITL